MKRQVRLSLIIMVVFISVIAGLSVAIAAYPEKPIEFVVHQAPGGGSDLFTRAIVDMLGKERIITVPMLVLNKAGGSGAVSVSYVMQKKADPYTIFATTTPVYSTMVKRHISLDEFTPLCRMAIDPIVFTVSGASPYKDVTEVIAAAKKTRKGIKMGIGSIGGTDHQVGEMIARTTGAEFNIISFKSGGEAMTAVLGGHVDFSCSNYAEAVGQIEAGKLRMLATAGEKRLPYLPNLPTLKERGIDVVFSQARGFFLTKGVPPEAVKYFEMVFDKLRKTTGWEKYLKENYLLDAPLSGSEFKAWLANQFIFFEKNLRAMGQFDK